MTPLASLTFNTATFTGWSISALLIALLAVTFAYLLGLRWQNQSLRFRLALLALRLGAIACLLLALLEPTWQRTTTQPLRPLIAVVLDDSASMTRQHHYQQALAALTQLRSVLRDTHDIRLHDLRGRTLTAPPKQPTHATSPLIDALLDAQSSSRPGRFSAQSSSRRGRFSAPGLAQRIVLLCDGHPATSLPSQGTLDQLTTPVDTLILSSKPRQSDSAALGSSPSGGLNLSIQSVAAGPNALLNNTVLVAIDLLADSPPAEPLAVPLTILDGSQIIAARTIAWPAGRNAIRAELPMTPRRPGRWTYLVQLGSLPHEQNLADNRAAFTLNVRSKPLVVVYVDGALRWEGKFIRQALSDDPDIHVISSVRTAPGRGQLIAPAGMLLDKSLADTDLVILGDVDATSFSTVESQALEHWVNTSGGAILLTGGYRGFGPNGFGRSNLRTILPILFTADDQPQIEQPFSLKLTQAGREHPIFHLTGDTVRDAAFYQSLPPLAGCNRIAAVKPGAQVLAVNPNTSGGVAAGLPVMIEQQVGAGRTMVFAVDTTWRWRQVVGGFTGDRSFYQRFWGQLVRYLVRSPQATDSALSLSSDRDRADVGQPITLTASLAQPGRWRLAAHAIDERGQTTSLPLTDAGGGRYTTTVTPVESGRLDLVVRADPPPEAQNNKPTQTGVPALAGMSQVLTVHVRPKDLEAGVTDIDRAWLASVSGRTGGRSMTVDELTDWAKSLPSEPMMVTANTTTRLWDHPALSLLFFTCLCGEWLLRRRSRLA
ncbi:MAG: glutamine amidotransferase [Phycisphaerales bacterium]